MTRRGAYDECLHVGGPFWRRVDQLGSEICEHMLDVRSELKGRSAE